jgi:hypothetical protein
MHGSSFAERGNGVDKENRAGAIVISLLSPFSPVPSILGFPQPKLRTGKVLLSRYQGDDSRAAGGAPRVTKLVRVSERPYVVGDKSSDRRRRSPSQLMHGKSIG